MNKYEQQPDEIIDLHGLSVSESLRVLVETIECEELNHVRVIVGKGTHSPHGPVLRDAVKHFFVARNIRFSQSKLSDGGEGALEVFFE